MPAINADNVGFWKDLAADLSKQRPYPGRRITVTGGRKWKGKTGQVLRHEVNRFGDAWRYGGDANLQMREMAGRYGFRCQVRADSGEVFWVDADKVECL